MPAAVGDVSPKQLREPVWHAGPSGSTTSSSVSRSQSARASTTRSVWPEVSPLRQSALPAAAPEVREAGLGRLRDRLRVGPGEHQHVAAGAVLGDHGQQAVRVEDEAVGHRDGHQRPPPTTLSTRHGRLDRRAHADAPRQQLGLRLGDADLAEVEHRRRERGARAPGREHLRHVGDAAAAARGDHRHAHGLGHGARQRQVVAVLRPVAVHAGEQDLAGAALGPLARPGHRVPAGRRAAAVDEHLEAAGAPARASIASTTACEPKRRAICSTSAGSFTAAVLTATLSAPARSSTSASPEAAHAAADGERQVDGLRHAPHHLDHDRPRVRGGGDVEEHQLVGPAGVVADGRLDGIARVAQRHEAHALHDAAAVDVEAGDEPLGEHQPLPASASASWAAASVTRPS